MIDIYVQEVTALVYLQKVPLETKDVVLQVARSCQHVLFRAET